MSESSGMFKCAGCERQYKWKLELAGKKVKCQCGELIRIPNEMSAAPATSSSSQNASTTPPPPPIQNHTNTTASHQGELHETLGQSGVSKVTASLLLIIVYMLITLLARYLVNKSELDAARLIGLIGLGGAIVACVLLSLANPGGLLKTAVVAASCFAISIDREWSMPSGITAVFMALRPIGFLIFFLALQNLGKLLGDQEMVLRTRRMFTTVMVYFVATVVLVICNHQQRDIPLKLREAGVIVPTALVFWIYSLVAMLCRMIALMWALNHPPEQTNNGNMGSHPSAPTSSPVDSAKPSSSS